MSDTMQKEHTVLRAFLKFIVKREGIRFESEKRDIGNAVAKLKAIDPDIDEATVYSLMRAVVKELSDELLQSLTPAEQQ
jgi:hypothetical protein